jgi:hypothetical protein
MEKIDVLNVSFFHMAWANTYICRSRAPILGLSYCEEKHLQNIKAIAQRFQDIINDRVSLTLDNSRILKLSDLNSQQLDQFRHTNRLNTKTQ